MGREGLDMARAVIALFWRGKPNGMQGRRWPSRHSMWPWMVQHQLQVMSPSQPMRSFGGNTFANGSLRNHPSRFMGTPPFIVPIGLHRRCYPPHPLARILGLWMPLSWIVTSRAVTGIRAADELRGLLKPIPSLGQSRHQRSQTRGQFPESRQDSLQGSTFTPADLLHGSAVGEVSN